MPEHIDLVLINPGNRQHAYGKLGEQFSGIEPPVWCALIAAFVRQNGYSVKIIDADVECFSPQNVADEAAKYSPLLIDVIVLGANPSASSTPKMPIVRETISAIKKASPNIKIILSGLHPSALAERTLQEEKADFVCRGEGFFTIWKLLEAIKSNKEIPLDKIEGLCYRKNGKIFLNPAPPLVDINKIPLAAWELLPMHKYRAHNWHCFANLKERSPYAAIYTSFGCPFNCSYCNIHAIYNDKPSIRYRTPEKVVEEIDLLFKNFQVQNIKIADELFVINEKRVDEICGLLIKRKYNLNIWAYARIDTVNEKILKKMKQAGINWLCYGIESANKKVRHGVSKMGFEREEIKKSIAMTHAAGIYVIGNFMFGLPEDDLETMQETLSLAKELNCEYVNFYAAMAYPGSQLYIEALAKGIKLPENWLGYSQLSEDALPLPTKYISNEEVLRFRDKAFEEYYSDAKYLKMMEEKFGKEALSHIEQMLKIKINRKLFKNKGVANSYK